MSDHPAPDAETMDGAALPVLVGAYPALLTEEEEEIRRETRGREIDVADALARLLAGGLVHRLDRFYFATRAAFHAGRLDYSWPATGGMHTTTVRFAGESWAELKEVWERDGVAAAQYIREATIARLAQSIRTPAPRPPGPRDGRAPRSRRAHRAGADVASALSLTSLSVEP